MTLAVVVTALITSPAVLGFGMIDLLRAARQSHQSPVDAIVNVFVEEMDVNNDSKIALSELGSYVDQVIATLGPDQGRNTEGKGYIMTVANLIDVDNSEQMDQSELHRASSYLVNLAGRRQLGRIVEVLLNMKRETVDRLVLAERIAADFQSVLDRNSDGLVSSDEIEDFSSLTRFQWNKEYIQQYLTDMDEDNDGNLSGEEIDNFLISLATERSWIFNQVYVYTRVYQLTGIDTANEWAETA